MDPAAGGLALAGGKTARLAGFQVEEVHLIKGVAGVALALEDHRPAGGAVVALAGALALEGELADVAEQPGLFATVRRFRGLGPETEQSGQRQGDRRCASHRFEIPSVIDNPPNPFP